MTRGLSAIDLSDSVEGGPLSIGRLFAVGVSGDCVKASIREEPFDRRDGRPYPGPVWVDVRRDAPRMSDGHTNAGVPPRENSGRPQIPAAAGSPQISASESAPRNRKKERAAIRALRGTPKVGHLRADSGNGHPSQRPK